MSIAEALHGQYKLLPTVISTTLLVCSDACRPVMHVKYAVL
jgi:hypothetical protein